MQRILITAGSRRGSNPTGIRYGDEAKKGEKGRNERGKLGPKDEAENDKRHGGRGGHEFPAEEPHSAQDGDDDADLGQRATG